MELLERDAELAAMSQRWRRACARAGSYLLVGGESGIGKTELVRQFAAEAADHGRVVWGACDPLHTPRPLGPLHDAARELGGHVAELLARGGFAHEIADAIFDELDATPTALVVEDLQWVDGGTLDVLRVLLRRISATRSLVVVTYRDDEIGATHPLRGLLGDAARTPDATWLPLRPLSVSAVAAIIGDRSLDAGRLHALTGGNPFFVVEVVGQGGADLPATVREAVLARTADLDDAARDVLELLACAPEAVPDAALRALGVGIRLLRRLDATGLVQRSRRGVIFRHELCRLAVQSAIPPGGDAALHARMLAALESLGTVDAATLAHHALGAGDHAGVLRHASLAGVEAARSSAHTQAAAFFGLALEHAGSTSAVERAELLELLAGELYLTDRLEDAISASERAMALRQAAGDLGGVGAAHEALSVYQWYNANRAVAEHHATAAVEVLERAADLPRLGHAYAIEAYLALQRGDLDRAGAVLARARQVAAAAGDRQLNARVAIIDAERALMDGNVSGRDRILSLIERETEFFDEIHSSGYSNLAYLDVEHRRLDAAAGVLARSLPLATERDIPICRVWQTGVRGRLAFVRGHWDAAVADADAVLAEPAAPLARTWPHLVRGLVRLRRGHEGADEDLDAAWELARRYGEPLRILPALAALAERAWVVGVDDDRLDDAGDRFARSATAGGVAWSAGEAVIWLRRLGRDVDAAAIPLAQPHRLALAGQPLEAAAAWDALGAPYERALALMDAGGDGCAVTALGVLDGLAAEAIAGPLRRSLRARGVADVPGRRRSSTRANPAGLTARELEVLALLDEGLTNAQLAEQLFISPKTADHHVSAILAKLRVASRRQAPDAARRLGVAL